MVENLTIINLKTILDLSSTGNKEFLKEDSDLLKQLLLLSLEKRSYYKFNIMANAGYGVLHFLLQPTSYCGGQPVDNFQNMILMSMVQFNTYDSIGSSYKKLVYLRITKYGTCQYFSTSF